jgi:regulator of RNase E activity RraB
VSIPTSVSSLARLAQTLDADLGDVDALPTGESASLVRVTRSGEVAVRSLDGDHPYDALLGFVAPEDWEVFGVIAPGWGTYYEGPRTGERRRCRAIHLVQRTGEEAALLRFTGDADGTVMQEQNAPGRVADCLRRAMGLPTPPPTEASLTALWADQVLRRIAARQHPSRYGELVDSCEVYELVGPRPATWDDARWAVIAGGGNEVMDATVATWMDAGMFAREMLADMIDPTVAMAEAKKACTPEGWRTVMVLLLGEALYDDEDDDWDDDFDDDLDGDVVDI